MKEMRDAMIAVANSTFGQKEGSIKRMMDAIIVVANSGGGFNEENEGCNDWSG